MLVYQRVMVLHSIVGICRVSLLVSLSWFVRTCAIQSQYVAIRILENCHWNIGYLVLWTASQTVREFPYQEVADLRAPLSFKS